MKKHTALAGILLALGVAIIAVLSSITLLFGIFSLLGQTSTQLETPFDWLFLLFFWILSLSLAIAAFVVRRSLQKLLPKL